MFITLDSKVRRSNVEKSRVPLVNILHPNLAFSIGSVMLSSRKVRPFSCKCSHSIVVVDDSKSSMANAYSNDSFVFLTQFSSHLEFSSDSYWKTPNLYRLSRFSSQAFHFSSVNWQRWLIMNLDKSRTAFCNLIELIQGWDSQRVFIRHSPVMNHISISSECLSSKRVASDAEMFRHPLIRRL